MTGLRHDESVDGSGESAKQIAGEASQCLAAAVAGSADCRGCGPGESRSAAESAGRNLRFPRRRIWTEVRRVPNLTEIWSYINPFMLYGRHLGYKGNFEKGLAERDPKALELSQPGGGAEVRGAEVPASPNAVWQFFEAERDGNSIQLFAAGRQRRRCTRSISAGSRERTGLCLSDYILPAENGRAIIWRCSW